MILPVLSPLRFALYPIYLQRRRRFIHLVYVDRTKRRFPTENRDRRRPSGALICVAYKGT